MGIQFDATNLSAAMVGGDHGITKSELKRGEAVARQALAGVRALVDSGEIGFPHLPSQQKTVAAIRKYAAEVLGELKDPRAVGPLVEALTDNKNQKAENERMRAREGAIDQRIQTALDGERGRLQQDREQVASDRQQTQGLLQDLQRRLDSANARASSWRDQAEAAERLVMGQQ